MLIVGEIASDWSSVSGKALAVYLIFSFEAPAAPFIFNNIVIVSFSQ